MNELRPRKRLGQHFLHDPAVIAKIVAEINPQRDDTIVEIGGGRGALTQPLLGRIEQLHVVETDPRMVAALEAFDPSGRRLIVHHADALEFAYDELAQGSKSLRVVGNLPYNISTPLLFRFVGYRDVIRDMHVMLQKEVVERMTAEPGSKRYGRLTVMLSLWTDIEACFDIGPGAFNPPPKVRSTLVRLVPRARPRFDVSDETRFARFVATLFSMRRKTLRRILRDKLSAAAIEAAGFDPTARPETLRPEEFARLCELGS
jgi:16S rRNA (adenine1518-N6/adenine1519-N6)-dimethyltransferase